MAGHGNTSYLIVFYGAELARRRDQRIASNECRRTKIIAWAQRQDIHTECILLNSVTPASRPLSRGRPDSRQDAGAHSSLGLKSGQGARLPGLIGIEYSQQR